MDEARLTLDRTFVECSALGFQSTISVVLGIACLILYERARGEHFRTWALAWYVYVVRLAFMSTFLVRRDMVWLFAHQAATGVTMLLFLAAALQLSRGFRLRLGQAHGEIRPTRGPEVAACPIRAEGDQPVFSHRYSHPGQVRRQCLGPARRAARHRNDEDARYFETEWQREHAHR